ncbi:MAG: site-specific integrase [Thermoleophilaceae bacterium]|nr:site-specific integrase [Thermoleophilaceae bacterium]
MNKLLVILSGIFKRAGRVYGLGRNPVAQVDRQPQKRSDDFRTLTAGEVVQLAAAAESDQDAVMFVVAAFTGLRLGELRALTWGDVDFTKALLHVRRSYTKGAEGLPKSGKVRSVPLIDRAARALDGLSRRDHFTGRDDLVFCTSTGGFVDDTKLRRRYYAALQRAGLHRIRFHDLRHVFGTIAVQAFPLSDVKAYMGHKDISTTMVYVHHVPQHEAADRLGQVVEAATDPFAGNVSPNVSRTEENSAVLSATRSAV